MRFSFLYRDPTFLPGNNLFKNIGVLFSHFISMEVTNFPSRFFFLLNIPAQKLISCQLNTHEWKLLNKAWLKRTYRWFVLGEIKVRKNLRNIVLLKCLSFVTHQLSGWWSFCLFLSALCFWLTHDDWNCERFFGMCRNFWLLKYSWVLLGNRWHSVLLVTLNFYSHTFVL